MTINGKELTILKTTKNTVKIKYDDTFFTLNKFGVLCCESKMADGKTWYTFCPSCYPEKDMLAGIKHWLANNICKYEFEYKL